MIMLHRNIFRIVSILKTKCKARKRDNLKEETLLKVSLKSLKMRSNIFLSLHL